MLTLTLFAIFVAKGSTTTTIPVVNTVNLPIDLGNSGNKGPGVCVNNTYMEKIPADPGSNSYYYNRSGSNSYVLCASLETSTEGLKPDCGSNCVGICNYKVINP